MNVLEDFLFDPALNKDWHMQYGERAALMHALRKAEPDISIEIGTYLAGSLRPIAAASRHVYTFDIDPSTNRTGPEFPNVDFVTGDSKETLPQIIARINDADAELNFVLIDGAHSKAGVMADITEILKYVPKTRPTVIVIHDSSNPDVREGILASPWADCPYVQVLDVDYVPGMLYDRADIYGQIWGGLAAAIMSPERRACQLPLSAAFDFSVRLLADRGQAILA